MTAEHTTSTRTTAPVTTAKRRVGFVAGTLAAAALSTAALLPAAGASGGTTVGLTGGVVERPAAFTGETFFKSTAYNVSYTGGSVILSGDAAGTADLLSDDWASVKVIHQDGSSATWSHNFAGRCRALRALPPQDLAAYFEPGNNTVVLTLRDRCGGMVSATGFYITP